MNNKLLKIATRNSPLALAQTNIIKNHLKSIYPNLKIELVPLTTEGDKRLDMSLATVGGKGLFVKELEQAMLDGHADLAVHSAKDMPASLPENLTIAVFYKRDDPRDVLVANNYSTLASLPVNAVIGTASLRRQSLIKHLRPDLSVKILRGNVQTRIKKLDANEYDAIILAAAGLERLMLTSRIKEYFNPEIFVPAVTQGIMCIECRKEDVATIELLKPLHDQKAAICATAERAMNYHLQGGCQVPIGAYADLSAGQLKLRGLVGSPDGKLILRATSKSRTKDAEQLGLTVANQLLDQGAAAILQQVYQPHD